MATVHIMKDVDGRTVVLSSDTLMNHINDNLASVLGLSVSTISELRRGYLRLGGKLPITAESVEELFSNL